MLFYRTYGCFDKQPIVFLHGFLGSSLDFTPLIEKLAKDYLCISIDLPAHGLSPYLPGVISAVQKTIESFKITPFLLGYSLGGRIALYLSQKTTLPIKGSIILSSHTGLDCPSQKQSRLIADLAWKKKLETLSSLEFLEEWYKQPVFYSLHKKPLLLKELFQKRLFTNPNELGLVLEEMSLANYPLLNTFSSPTYFLYGEEDYKIKDLYSSFPSHIAKTEIKEAGHTVHLENTEACNDAIQGWIANRSKK